MALTANERFLFDWLALTPKFGLNGNTVKPTANRPPTRTIGAEGSGVETPVSVDLIMAKIRERARKYINDDEPLTPQACEFLNPTRLANSYSRMGPEESRAYWLDKWLRGISSGVSLWKVDDGRDL